ncbi:hypothetical protein AALB53_08370 [Lachnospiraceae bacterium 47-T17]
MKTKIVNGKGNTGRTRKSVNSIQRTSMNRKNRGGRPVKNFVPTPDTPKNSHSVPNMVSHLQNKTLIYSVDDNAYIKWLCDMAQAGEAVDALVELKSELRSWGRLSSASILLVSDVHMPDDYVELDKPVNLAVDDSNDGFEVEII